MPKVRHFNSRTAVSLLLVCCFLLSCIGFHSSAEDDIPLMPVKHVFESKDLTAFAAGAKADGEAVTAGDEGYFTLVYSEKTKVDGSIKEWDDGYTSSQRVNFGGKMTAKYHYVAFATQMPGAKVTVWWVEGGDDGRQISVTDASGKEVFRTEATVAKNMPCRSVFILDEPGEYHLGCQPGNNYIFKIAVEDHRECLPGEVPPVRRAWNEVPDPVIEGIEIRPDSISVKIEMNVGFDGADMVTAVLSDMSGEPLLTRSVSAEGDHHTITFTPSSSGSYSAAVFAVREGEHDKTCAPAACEGFLLPLTAPAAVVDRNLGGGSVKISWNPVPEADTYQVYVNEKLLSEEGTVTVFTEGESAVIHGLPIGKNSRICVQACRLSGETSPLSEEVYFKATEDPAFVWNSVVFGPSTTLKDNGCIFSGRRPAMIYSESGKGKIVPGSTDGIAFWYTQLDAHTENFILSGTIHVDGWTYSNGQEGMGIAVLDTIGVNGSSAPVWNNSMMGVATKVEYTRSGNKISMRLGIGALIKTGVTAEDAGSFRETGMFSYSDGTSGTVPEKFDSVIVPLETSCLPLGKGTYNLIGNWRGTAPEGDQADKDITVMRFELSRDNTGYLLRYLDEEGSPIGERTLYDADRTVFASVDPDHIYIGFFAARNARITVSDVSLTVTDAAQDPPAGEKPPETYPVDVAFESALVSGSEDYTLVLFGNTNGHIAVMNDAGAVVAEGDALAGQKLRLPVKLHEGSNTFSAVFQPDAAYLNEKGAMPDITEAFSLTHTIIFRKLTGDMIYVSPDGTSTGDGSPDHPVDIDTALSFASAGQTVVLKEGIYHIEGKLSAPRGNDGTEASPIRVIRDPAAASRPVLDFDGIGGGVTFGGEWWEISGFDVTNTSNSNKGVQISGNHILLQDVRAYRNGNTGIQITRLKSSDTREYWPHDNTVRGCVSFLNADSGYEDADGFAAKLTVGDNNVFDSCIAAFNADDGWDCYAKAETGSIGSVTIMNCVAFRNGYVLDENDTLIPAGNGNGFKLGGESLPGGHIIINSIAFANKTKGIDSNSCPDIRVFFCTSFDNGAANIAFYTGSALNTAFRAEGVLSLKSTNYTADNLKLKGTQAVNDVYGISNYYFDGVSSSNSAGEEISTALFACTDTDSVINSFIRFIHAGDWSLQNGKGICFDAEGSVCMNGYLELVSPFPAGADLNDPERGN